MSNIALKEGFKQVCVWPGTIVGPEQIEEFERFFVNEMKTRVQYLEEVYTLPDADENGQAIPGTGGRCDCLFAVHKDDLGGFAVPRLQLGVRWIEDVYSNGGGALYPERVAEYRTW